MNYKIIVENLFCLIQLRIFDVLAIPIKKIGYKKSKCPIFKLLFIPE